MDRHRFEPRAGGPARGAVRSGASRRHAYEALDGVRGIAAIAVVLHHFPPIRRPELFYNGLMAVDMFYLLSGFVVAHAYDARLAGGLGVRRFLHARIVRLWPLIVLGVGLGLLQGLLSPIAGKDLPMPVAERVACSAFNGFILPCPLRPSLMFPADPPEWSLFYELCANLLFALTFKWISKPWRLAGLVAAAGSAAAAGIWRYHGLRFPFSPEAMPFDLARAVFAFFLGVLLHRTRSLWIGRTPVLSPWAIYALVLGLLAVPRATLPVQAILHLATVFVFGPGLVMLGSVARPRGFARTASTHLGDLSYPLYAVHMPLIFLGLGLVSPAWRPSAFIDAGLVVAAGCIAAALPSIYDMPIRRKLAPAS